jgi:hypothetical protein
MRILWLFVFLVLAYCGFGQKRTEDVVHLKNGSSLRGMILPDSGQSVKLQTSDGSILVFNKEEISLISKEARFRTFYYKEKGFGHFTELGPLVAGKTTIDGVTTAAFSFQMVNGYKFSQLAFIGLGAGVDLYATQTVIPLFGTLRGDLSRKGSIIPFYFLDAGYGFNITENSDASKDFKGGLLYAGGFGVKIPFNRSAGFLLSVGYRFQRTSFMQDAGDRNIDYRRLALRAGFWL